MILHIIICFSFIASLPWYFSHSPTPGCEELRISFLLSHWICGRSMSADFCFSPSAFRFRTDAVSCARFCPFGFFEVKCLLLTPAASSRLSTSTQQLPHQLSIFTSVILSSSLQFKPGSPEPSHIPESWLNFWISFFLPLFCLQLKHVLRIMKFGSQFLSNPGLKLSSLNNLFLFDLFGDIRCSELILIHKLIPLGTKLRKFLLLHILSLDHFSFVQYFEILVSPFEFPVPDLLYLCFTVLGFFVVASLLTFLAVFVEQPSFSRVYFRKSMSLSSTFLQRAYFSSILSLVFSERQKTKRN